MKAAIKTILAAYKRDDYADPDGFVTQVGLVMEPHSEETIREATDPRNPDSVQRKHPTFPPTVGDCANVLEAISGRRERTRLQALAPKAIAHHRPAFVPKTNPGCFANCFVDAEAPQYVRLYDWSKTAAADVRDWRAGTSPTSGRPGIWVAWNIFEALCMSARGGGAFRKVSARQ